MKKKRDPSLLILIALTLIIAAVALWIGGWQRVVSGLANGIHLVNIVWLRLALGFILAGLIQVVISHELISRWLGPTSGMKGILIGSYSGIFMLGGPYVRFPIIASIYRAGAGIGPVIALMTANILGINQLIVWQIPFLGVGISLARYIVCLFIPPLAGLAGAAVYRLLTVSHRAPEEKPHDAFAVVGQQHGKDRAYAPSKNGKEA